MGLIDYILGLVLTMTVMVIVHNHEIDAFRDQARDAAIKSAASEQIQFGRAIGGYLEIAHLSRGATISVASLEAAGMLPSGFPAANPLGQTPEAFVGGNNTAIATYTGAPSQAIASALGYNAASPLSMAGMMEKMVMRASLAQQPLAYMLIAVQVQNGVASSPFTGRSIALSNYFSGYPETAVPIFAELINMDTLYAGGVNE